MTREEALHEANQIVAECIAAKDRLVQEVIADHLMRIATDDQRAKVLRSRLLGLVDGYEAAKSPCAHQWHEETISGCVVTVCSLCGSECQSAPESNPSLNLMTQGPLKGPKRELPIAHRSTDQMLCDACNRGLGCLSDNAVCLAAATCYVTRSS